MKKNILMLISVSLLLFSTACALEIANVIGPDGGYVFYDKGSYNYGWRYIQCSSYDFGNVRDNSVDSVKAALKFCSDNNANWHKLGWELPTEDSLRKLLECFSYGFTKFSPDYYYLAVNNLYDAGKWWVCGCVTNGEGVKNTGKFCTNCGAAAPAQGWIENKNDPPNPAHLKDESAWEVIILHKNFEQAANGTVERVNVSDIPDDLLIRVRAIRRF